MKQTEPSGTTKFFTKEWLKKIGLLGFLFFLIKGLAWIAVTYLLVK